MIISKKKNFFIDRICENFCTNFIFKKKFFFFHNERVAKHNRSPSLNLSPALFPPSFFPPTRANPTLKNLPPYLLMDNLKKKKFLHRIILSSQGYSKKKDDIFCVSFISRLNNNSTLNDAISSSSNFFFLQSDF